MSKAHESLYCIDYFILFVHTLKVQFRPCVLMYDIVTAFCVPFVTDGFAFSQEEHGAVLQVQFARFIAFLLLSVITFIQNAFALLILHPQCSATWKTWKSRRNYEKVGEIVVCLWCATAVVIVTK